MHIQGGTHEETPRPEMSVMDRAACLFAEMGVSSGVVQVKLVSAKEVELIDCKAEFPGDVGPMEGRGFNLCWGFLLFSSAGMRHGVVFKRWRKWVHL